MAIVLPERPIIQLAHGDSQQRNLHPHCNHLCLSIKASVLCTQCSVIDAFEVTAVLTSLDRRNEYHTEPGRNLNKPSHSKLASFRASQFSQPPWIPIAEMPAFRLTRRSQSTWRGRFCQCPFQRKCTGNDCLRPHSRRNCICWGGSGDGIVLDARPYCDRRQGGVDSVRREDRESIGRSRQHGSNGCVDSDTCCRSDSR